MQNMMMQETSLTRKIFKSKQDSLHFERKKTNQLDKDFAIINFVHVRSLLPTSQLTTHRNKKGKEKKEKKKERRNWSLPVKNLIRGSDRRSITVSRAGERPRHSSKSRWIDRAIERSTNGLPPRKILRLSRWSAFAPHATEAR